MTGPQPTASEPAAAHQVTQYGTVNCPVDLVRAEIDAGGNCSACGMFVEQPTAGAGDVERLLAAHAAHVGWSDRHWNADCLAVDCDWSGYGDDGGPAGMAAAWAAHRGHVASVLATLLADVRREERERAGAEALREAANGLYLSRSGQHNEGAREWLHRRANLIDPRTRDSVCEHGNPQSEDCGYCATDVAVREARGGAR